MEQFLSLLTNSVEQVFLALVHNWPYLALSIIIATLLKLYVSGDKVSSFLTRHRGAGVAAATAVAVTTPLCSCGTTAAVLGMMASTLPWAPIVAFMVASPLTSPEGLVYTAGLFGWPFSLTFYLASIVMGLGGGWIAGLIERRGWLANQSRFNEAAPVPPPASTLIPIIQINAPAPACGCAQAALVAVAAPVSACACDPVTSNLSSTISSDDRRLQLIAGGGSGKVTYGIAFKEMLKDGRRLLSMFLGFAFIGYFLNSLIPSEWVAALFGSGKVYNVPLAATLGLPFYINSETSMPMVRAFLDSGMSQGAALAFLIAGAGTSVGAITGALAIARWRVIALVVAILWAGAVLSGVAFDLWLAI